MGRYKDYDRDPKRRGYEDDGTSDNLASGGRPNYPRPSASPASEPVEAIVKRFNAEKGFGFVAVVGGPDAFIHIRQLEEAGHSNVPEGAHIKVRIGQGQKGPEVTEVIEVNLSESAFPTEIRLPLLCARYGKRLQHHRHRRVRRVPSIEDCLNDIGRKQRHPQYASHVGFVDLPGGGGLRASRLPYRGIHGLMLTGKLGPAKPDVKGEHEDEAGELPGQRLF